MSALETNIRNTYETRIHNMKTEHETNITNIINRGDPEADKKINDLLTELDRLNNLLGKIQK